MKFPSVPDVVSRWIATARSALPIQSSPEVRYMPVFGSKITAAKYLALAVFGKPGAGDTYLIRTLVESGFNVALLDCDGGSSTLSDLEGHKRFRYADCTSMEKFNAAWSATDELDDSWILAVDTFTALLDMKAQAVGGTKDKLSFDDHAKVGSAGVKILLQVKSRAKGKDVILLCQEDRLQDEVGRMYWGPRLHGRMTGKVFADKFDGVLRLYVEAKVGGGVSYKMLTGTTGDCETKLRVTPAQREEIPQIIEASEAGDMYTVLRRRGVKKDG